jgi:hypothetical protein
MSNELIPVEIIQSKIFYIRGKKVMIDRDLAELYEVKTYRLNEVVKRNKKRFPDDFMFQLNDNEKNELIANCDRFQTLKYSTSNPYVFTEQGVAMLSSVLNSDRAIFINIQIMRAFVEMRKLIASNELLLRKIEAIEQTIKGKFNEYDESFQTVFQVLKQLIEEPEEPPKQIGFRTD